MRERGGGDEHALMWISVVGEHACMALLHGACLGGNLPGRDGLRLRVRRVLARLVLQLA